MAVPSRCIRLVSLLLFTVCLGSLLTLPGVPVHVVDAASAAAPIVLTFDPGDPIDGLAPGVTLGTQYQAAAGVTFTANAYSGQNTVPVGLGTWASNTALTIGDSLTDSGTLGTPDLVSGNLFHAYSFWLNEDGDPSFNINLSPPVLTLSADFAGVGTIATQMVAYDRTGNVVDTVIAENNPEIIQTRLTVTSVTPIFRVAVVPGSYNDWVGVDNISFVQTTPPAEPAATTSPASAIGPNSATLNGAVSANNDRTTVLFEWGTTAGGPYPNTTAATPATLTGTASTPVSATLMGLTPNTTYYYRVVATNGLGSVEGTERSFTSLAIPPTATTNAASATTGSGATLNGRVNANNTSTLVTFEWGRDPGGPYSESAAATPNPVTGTRDTTVSAVLSGLSPNTTYHYRVVAVSSAGTAVGAEQSFTTATLMPIVTTGAATGVGAGGATLRGTVNANNSTTTAVFEWGTTAGGPYPNTLNPTPGTINGLTAQQVRASLTGLVPNTRYYFRLVATNAAGTTRGGEQVFTTSAVAPTATTNAASAVSGFSARLNGSVNANNASTSVQFEWGTAARTYPNVLPATPGTVTGTSSRAVTADLTDLIPNTTYYYRVTATNSGGTATGGEQRFTTALAPSAVTRPATGVTGVGVTLNAAVNPQNASTTVTFEWGTTPGGPYANTVAAVPETLTGLDELTVTASLGVLPFNTTYYYRVVAINDAGRTNGAEQSFRVLPNTVAAIGGALQATTVGSAFSDGLQVLVRDAGGLPLPGVPVTFTAPPVGPSGTFNGDSTATVATDTAGVATSPPFVANRIVGSYVVTATSVGTTGPALFRLTNRLFSSFLPTVAAPAFPNLAIASVKLTPDRLNFSAGEPVAVSVVVKNTGDAPAPPFWVDLYLNPAQRPQPNLTWNQLCTVTPCFGLSWYAPGLRPGESMTLTSTVSSFVAGQSVWPGYFAAGTTDLFVLADSWKPGSPTGAASESNEGDNLFIQRGLDVTGPNPPGTPLVMPNLPVRPAP